VSAFDGNGNGKRPDYEAIVVGGGHNGLTAAAYLARAGLRVCVLEARDILGGACVTEELWPGQRVSRASYVVSMLQPKVVADLELTKFGYHPIPLDPEFATFAADGRPLLLPYDDKVTYEQVARVSRKDADNLAPCNALFEKAALFLKPLMLRPPPAAGSKRPGDVFELLREAGRAAGLSRRDLTDIFRLMTMSVGDLLDDYFETDELKGAYASSVVVGVWAGPYTPGTAYNLLHHALGEVDGVQGAWGHVRGGMGAISEAIAASARAAGATVRTGAPVASIDVAGGRVTGVTLASGETLSAGLVMSGAHPWAAAHVGHRDAAGDGARARHAPLARPGLGRGQHHDAAAVGDARARLRRRHVPALHDGLRLHRAGDDGAGHRPGDLHAVVGGAHRPRAPGDDRRGRRGGRRQPRGAAAPRRRARAAAAARTGHGGEPARVVRAVDRRLRRQSVPRFGR
jgi:phytoene dehydrogenase-like protein